MRGLGRLTRKPAAAKPRPASDTAARAAMPWNDGDQFFYFEALETRILLSADPGVIAVTPAIQKQPIVMVDAGTPSAQVVSDAPSGVSSLDAVVKPAATPVQANWIGGAAGRWDTAANWSTGVVPDSTTDVTISGKDTITVGNDAARALTLQGGVTLTGGSLATNAASTSNGSSFNGTTLDLTGGLTLTGSNSLTSATLAPTTGAVTNTGTLSLSQATTSTIQGAFDNKGTVSVNDGAMLTLASANGSVSDINEAAGVIDLVGSGGIRSNVGQGSPLVVTNAGLLEKTGNAGTSTINVPSFNNQGTIDVAVGSLGFTGGEMVNSADASIAVEQGATFDLTSNKTEIYGGTLTGTGAGTIALANGTLQIDAAGFTIDAAPGLFQWTGGVIDATNNAPFDATTYVFTNAGSMTLAGGTHSVGGTFDNTGIIDDTSGSLDLLLYGYFNKYSATLNNSGSYIFQGDNGIDDGLVNNTGLIEKAAGTGNSTISSNLTNTAGTLSAQTGTITSASFDLVLQGGTFNAAAGAAILFNPVPEYGSYTLGGTLGGTGAGSVTFDGDGVTIGAGGALFDFAPGLLQWSGGAIDAVGTLTNTGTINLSGSIGLDGVIDNTNGVLNVATGQVTLTRYGTILEGPSTPAPVRSSI